MESNLPGGTVCGERGGRGTDWVSRPHPACPDGESDRWLNYAGLEGGTPSTLCGLVNKIFALSDTLRMNNRIDSYSPDFNDGVFHVLSNPRHA